MSCVLGQSCLDCATLRAFVFHFFRKHKHSLSGLAGQSYSTTFTLVVLALPELQSGSSLSILGIEILSSLPAVCSGG